MSASILIVALIITGLGALSAYFLMGTGVLLSIAIGYVSGGVTFLALSILTILWAYRDGKAAGKQATSQEIVSIQHNSTA